jgi:hypothetical protein
MEFCNYTTLRDWCRRSGVTDMPCQDAEAFYRMIIAEAQEMRSGQFYGQVTNERDWERARRPYYNVWPSIVPMLTRLDLDIDSALVQLPLPVLCIRLPKSLDQNPMQFTWQNEPVGIRCLMLAEINDGTGLSILIDIGEVAADTGVPICTYRNFPRKPGLTVEQSLAGLAAHPLAEIGIQIPEALITDCVRLCCSLCLLENDPSVIQPDVLAKDRDKFQRAPDEKYIERAQRRGKVGWDVGRKLEVIPHFRRPHLMLAWTGAGRSVPKIVPRRGSIVHRELVEKLPTGFGAEEP